MANEQDDGGGNRVPADSFAADDGQTDENRSGSGGDTTGSHDIPGPLLEVVADPAQGRHRLPYLLGLLDDENPQRRLTAGTAICLVVEAHPEMCAYAVGRLVDRLGDDAPVEVVHALDYLAARRPKDVDRAVANLDDRAEQVARRQMYETGGGFTRNDYLAPKSGGRVTGLVRLAGETASDDPRSVYTDHGRNRDGPADPSGVDTPSADDAGEDGTTDSERRDSDVEDGTAANETPTDTSDGVAGRCHEDVTSGTLTLVSNRLAEVIDASRFEDLSVLTERRRDRYGDVYRAVGTLDGDQHAVALTVYRLPETGRKAFANGLQSAFADWSSVDDHENVLTVYDWGVRPRPWAAFDYTDLTLANRSAAPTDSLATAVELADAVGYAHQLGVVHGALDPGNVSSLDTVLDETQRRQPLLRNFGLAKETNTVMPGVGVDPRYAAPEHFDESYGRVDHATDVYGLGTLLYRLASGRHPYDGDPDAIEERVLSDDPLELAETDTDLPGELDQILQKATATQKIRRYETVTSLERELRELKAE